MGQFSKSLAFVELGTKEAGGDELIHLQLEEYRAHIVGYRGEPRKAIELLRGIVQEMKALGARKEYGNALLEMAEFSASLNDMEGAFSLVGEASAVFEEVGDAEMKMSAASSLGDLHFSAGDLEAGIRAYEDAAVLARRLGRFRSAVWIHLYHGLLLEAAGDYAASLDQSLKALEACGMIESTYAEAAVRANLVRGYLREENPNDAERSYEAMNVNFEGGKDASLTLQAAVARSRGFYLWAKGRWKEADEEYANSIAKVQQGPLGSIHEAETRREYATLLASKGRNREAAEQARAAIALYSALGNRAGATNAGSVISAIE